MDIVRKFKAWVENGPIDRPILIYFLAPAVLGLIGVIIVGLSLPSATGG